VPASLSAGHMFQILAAWETRVSWPRNGTLAKPVDLADTLSVDDLGSLRKEALRQKRKEKLDQQLRNQVREARLAQLGPQSEPGPSQGPASAGQQSKGKSSISSETTEEMIRIKNHAKEEVRKRRQT
jgi:hypothetical protein